MDELELQNKASESSGDTSGTADASDPDANGSQARSPAMAAFTAEDLAAQNHPNLVHEHEQALQGLAGVIGVNESRMSADTVPASFQDIRNAKAEMGRIKAEKNEQAMEENPAQLNPAGYLEPATGKPQDQQMASAAAASTEQPATQPQSMPEQAFKSLVSSMSDGLENLGKGAATVTGAAITGFSDLSKLTDSVISEIRLIASSMAGLNIGVQPASEMPQASNLTVAQAPQQNGGVAV